MRCHKARKWISTRLDKELDEGRTRLLDEHLAGCETCQAFAAPMTRLAGELGWFECPEPQADFADRVVARLGDQPWWVFDVRGWGELLRPAPVGVAAAAFVFGVALTWLSPAQEVAEVATAQPPANVLVGDFLAAAQEDAVEDRMLAMLWGTEE